MTEFYCCKKSSQKSALESGLTPHEVSPLLLAGILGFFALEKQYARPLTSALW